mmetsp:Transcript_5299/g.16190  ORF Transcript_5299/g.16190 Transcript_5299/m.16190 type:complete len:304 (+) Transcript_5299:519-1430(+)
MRFFGMPLERLAMVLNSSQVSGRGQFSQAVKIVFGDGVLAPFRNVGRASIVAWFLQYSVMGCVFQVCDRTLSQLFGVKTIPYGDELMGRPNDSALSAADQIKSSTKILLTPMLAGAIESTVSNRAEAQRFYGIQKFAKIEATLNTNVVARGLGPGFCANASRNFIMASSSFVVTPLLYQRYYPQEKKDARSLFWFGLGINIFAGNMIAITQQALWGRALDYGAVGGGRPISYGAVIRDGLKSEGIAAFITPTKWFARVLMNAPVQGTLPWFFNEILPIGEPAALEGARSIARSFKGIGSPAPR